MPRLPRPRALMLLARHRAVARNLTALVLALLVGAAASALQLAGAASSPLSALDEAAHDLQECGGASADLPIAAGALEP